MRIPQEKSIRSLQGSDTAAHQRTTPLRTEELIAELNPVLRGWGEYYKRAHVRKLFQPSRPLDRATHLVAPIQALA